MTTAGEMYREHELLTIKINSPYRWKTYIQFSSQNQRHRSNQSDDIDTAILGTVAKAKPRTRSGGGFTRLLGRLQINASGGRGGGDGVGVGGFEGSRFYPRVVWRGFGSGFPRRRRLYCRGRFRGSGIPSPHDYEGNLR